MLKKIFLGVIVNGLALYVVVELVKNISYTGGFKFFLIGGLVIGTLNTFVKPFMKLLSLPIIILTIGLFSFVINVVIFWLTTKAINAISIADVTVQVQGLWTYVLAALIFALVNWALHLVIRK
jgi:putative membrane protein